MYICTKQMKNTEIKKKDNDNLNPNTVYFISINLLLLSQKIFNTYRPSTVLSLSWHSIQRAMGDIFLSSLMVWLAISI